MHVKLMVHQNTKLNCNWERGIIYIINNSLNKGLCLIRCEERADSLVLWINLEYNSRCWVWIIMQQKPLLEELFIFYSLSQQSQLHLHLAFNWVGISEDCTQMWLIYMTISVMKIFFFGSQMVVQSLSPCFPVCWLPWPGQHWPSTISSRTGNYAIALAWGVI